jgi:antitoxin (DNA-binding transcriptional repressor) of toxin-antitoxin stability system
MDMATVHIPENEAARDLPGLLAHVRAGEEIVIEKEAARPVVLRVAASRGDACCRSPWRSPTPMRKKPALSR